MSKKIYSESGYINWGYLYPQNRAFQMIIGARGTGKTYGLLRYLIENDVKFIYLRRLQTQLDMCMDADGNPFKKVNADMGETITPFKSKNSVKFYRAVTVNDKLTPTGLPVGYGAALSTVATVRGIDYSDVDAIIFDEAIAMEGERSIKNEFGAFLNFYETVNRNRELEGRPAVKAFLLGNANRLANPYFSGWGFMRTALKMIRGGQMVYRTPDNTRMIVMLLNSPISGKKSATALYQNASADYAAMALDNAFRTDGTAIKSYNLKECAAVVSVGEIGIYRHKGTGKHYISKTVDKSKYYDGYGIGLKMFKRDYRLLAEMYLSRLLDFEDYESELIFRAYFDLD